MKKIFEKVKFKILNRLSYSLENCNNFSRDYKFDSSVKIYGSSINGNIHIDKYSKVKKSTLNNEISIGETNQIINSFLSGKITTKNNSKIYNCTLNGNITLGRFSSLFGPNLDIFTGKNNVEIGNFCSIARNVSMQAYNHNLKKITTYYIGANLFKEKWENEKVGKGNIYIKNDVWIGTHCVILGGVTINNGAIVAANSVINKDVPAYSIVAGSPAKVIGYRFDNKTISKLEKLAWWNWSLDKIKNNKNLFEKQNFEDKI